ncbi:MAG: M12 family metallo-peptidase, partial [Planctomycetota bacterium]
MPVAAIATLAVILALQLAPNINLSIETRPFPFLYQGNAGRELAPIVKELAALEKLDRVRFSGVALPRADGKTDILTLDLRRVRIGTNESRVAVDGVVTDRALEMNTSLWAGKIAGVPVSDVFLSFSRYGSRGWIAFENQRFELVASLDASGTWENSISTFMAAGESTLASAASAVRCGVISPNTTVPNRTVFSGVLPTIAASQTAATTFFTCTLAIETDYQFYQIYNDINAAQTYVNALLGAVAARFLEQVNVQINVTYLGIHTNINDGWATPDTPGATPDDLINEFKNVWGNGGAPVSANLYHFLSGSFAGGGRASYSDFCASPLYNIGNFAVTTALYGFEPFPVTPSVLTGDFRTVAHELGHNFRAPHTHKYCPPIDQCAPPNPPDTCYTSPPICISEGTIMSYCGGLCLENVTNISSIYFHPQSVADMRAYLMSTCAGIPVGSPVVEPFANLPIGGVPHEDARIYRFVDLDPSTGIKDFDCGIYTSDGSRETEFQLVGFTHQDIGVPVFAISDGIVVGTENGFPDLNTPGGGGCNWPYVGNHVNISHGGGISTFYGSLRNGSVSVTNGQRVRG